MEFALIAPVFIGIMLVFIGYGFYFTASNAVTQIAADAARTAVAGLTSAERSELAKSYIDSSTLDHPLLKKSRLSVVVADDAKNPNQFTVTLTYDASDLPVWKFYAFAMPDNHIRRFSTIRLGGL